MVRERRERKSKNERETLTGVDVEKEPSETGKSRKTSSAPLE